MGSLSIRNIPDEIHKNLRIRAARAGRSMEAEVRAILAAACGGGDPRGSDAASLQRFVDTLYPEGRPTSAVDDLLEEARREAANE